MNNNTSSINNANCGFDRNGNNHQTSYPPVVMREKRYDRSETERKRLSRNRLSNRRSTGYVTPEEIELAAKIINSVEAMSSKENAIRQS